ncbi:MAG: calcium-binding protein, partial [Pseudomonadota bacterium]|nr:calcium-binding protein [Pseudomonadota bacterium]
SDGFGVVSSFGVDPTFANVAGRDIMIVNARENSGNYNAFQTYQVRDNGTLKPLANTATEFDSASKFDVASVGNRDFVVTWGQWDAAPMQVLRLFKSGELRQVFNLPTSESAIYNRITTDLETVQIGGRSFVIASEVTVGSIMVYEIDRNGALTLVDQETPGRDDPWGSPEALEVFTEDGNHYLAAGGYGNALAVFQISNGGALTEVEELTPPNSAPLGRVYDIEAQDIDGKQFLFASTGAVDELRSLRFVAEDDTINGNRNDNIRRGTESDDQILGKGGHDTLRGRDGDDMIDGGNGNDRLLGMEGADNLRGGGGTDRVDGGTGDDFLFGDDGEDLLLGRDGNDRMYGGTGADRLIGHDGNDVMDGGGGNDRLFGGHGLDRLTDGAGADRLTGGPGLAKDVFVFVQDGRRDVITDYQDGLDKIDLTAFGATLDFPQLVISQSGDDVSVSVMGEIIVIRGADGPLSQFDLDQGDFIFA